MGGAHAARGKWSTSIVGRDFTVTHRERQTIAFRIALLHIVNARRISLQHRYLVRRRVFNPISNALSIWLREHDVTLRNRLLHLVRLFREINIGYAARDSIGPLFDVDVAFV